jgi:hypothetical protein
MKKYANKSGTSGVIAYDTESEAICIRFDGGAIYKYTYGSAGKTRVEKMKKLAELGEGLATYISRYVKEAYE